MPQVLTLATPEAPSEASPREAALRQMLQRKPDDRVAHVKLLEVIFQQGREEEFLREASLFRNGHKGNLDAPDWKAIQSIGLRLFPDSPVFADVAGQQPFRRFGDEKKARPHFQELAKAYHQLRDDPDFLMDLDREMLFVARRPTPLVHAKRLSGHLGGAQIYLKREDVAPPGTHLHTCIVGQSLLAQRLRKCKLITGTVRGQRGVLVAEVAARLGLKAHVYMGQEQVASEAASVFRMWLNGAEINSVDVSTLRGADVREAALQHWLSDPAEAMLVMGTDHGPEPYPTMAREFSAVTGRECRRQMQGLAHAVPDLVVARAGNNADAIGMFQPFLANKRVRLACVEGGRELPAAASSGKPATDAELSARQRRLSDAILEDSEYPSVRREHKWLKDTGRVQYAKVDPESVREAISLLSRLEGLIPAIETAHAVAWACAEARQMNPKQNVVIAICENADKDILKIGRSMGVPL